MVHYNVIHLCGHDFTIKTIGLFAFNETEQVHCNYYGKTRIGWTANSA